MGIYTKTRTTATPTPVAQPLSYSPVRTPGGGLGGLPTPANPTGALPRRAGVGNVNAMNQQLAAQEGGDASIAPTDSTSQALYNRNQYLTSRGLTAHDANDPSITHPSNAPTGIVNGNQVYYTQPTLIGGPNGVTAFNPNGASIPGQGGANTTRDTFTLGANLLPSNNGGGAGAGGAAGGAARGTGAASAYGGLAGYNNFQNGGNGGTSGAYGTQAQNDQNAANAANDARYNQALGINASGQQSQQNALDANYNNIYNTINANQSAELAALASAGTTAHAQEDRRLAAQQGSTSAGLAGRGLYNSTILDSLQRGNATDSTLIQNQINEAADQQRLGVYNTTGAQMVGALGDYAHAETQAQQYGQGQAIGIIGSRTDQGPDTSSLNHLLSQAGAMGGASGGGGASSDASLLAQYLAQQLGTGTNIASAYPSTAQNNQNGGYLAPGGAYNQSGNGQAGTGAIVPQLLLGQTIPAFLPGEGDPSTYNPTTPTYGTTGQHADPSAPPLPGMNPYRVGPNGLEYWNGTMWIPTATN